MSGFILQTGLSSVGKYRNEFNKILNISLDEQDILADMVGLKKHVERRHPEQLEYLDKLPEIIRNPDYIGSNPREKFGESFELIKLYSDNIMIGIKFDHVNKYLYVATLHEVSDYKISNRVNSGRIKPLSKS